MREGAGGEQAELCRDGDTAGTFGSQDPAGFYKSPAAQGPFSLDAGSILWSEGCCDTSLCEVKLCSLLPPSSSAGSEKGLQVAFCGCFAFREAFLSFRPWLTLPEEEMLQVPAMS